MNNKFASLGIALSRDEAKKVMGGLVATGGSGLDGTACTKDEDCSGITKTCDNGTVVTARCNKIRSVCQTVCVYAY
jgi:hypothetical protein